ncbi:hypothetical protein [Paracoccus aminophilus]|nr:hypothetical protein [Paracoccus aminophilus]
MPEVLRKVLHYYRVFKDTSKLQGRAYAFKRSAAFISTRLRARMGQRRIGEIRRTDAAKDIIRLVSTLPKAPTARPLLLIISDLQIRQCIHYRVDQKLRVLESIGVKAQFVRPDEIGHVASLLPFAGTVIIYRTVVPAKQIEEMKAAGIRVIFEFDDLVVGAEAVRKSGILGEITDNQGKNLCQLADQFLATAQLCDEIIVSTDFLGQLYERPAHGLAGKPIHVIPNFLERDCDAAEQGMVWTFAYTTPSGSIRSELEMLKAFLRSYDAVVDHSWSILVMGNPLAATELTQAGFQRGRIETLPFAEYDDYIQRIGSAGCVLIPLSDTPFNASKTPIRAMDAALAGTTAIFSPVGAFAQIHKELNSHALTVDHEDWSGAGTYAGSVFEARDIYVRGLQRAVNKLYGPQTARQSYHDLFVERFGLPACEASKTEWSA